MASSGGGGGGGTCPSGPPLGPALNPHTCLRLVWKFPKSMDIVQGAHGFSGHFTDGIIMSILREQN